MENRLLTNLRGKNIVNEIKMFTYRELINICAKFDF